MRRDMDLVRTILMRIEDNPSHRPPRDLEIAPYRAEVIGYHVHIMKQEGLIEGVNTTTLHSPESETTPMVLTWKGHEFLDLARDWVRWNQAKAIIAKVGSAPIAVWMKVLSDLLLKSVENVVARSS